MKTIYKYSIPVDAKDNKFEFSIPENAELLCIQNQNNYPVLWALIDTDNKEEVRKFKAIGTGHNVPHEFSFNNYVGTYQYFNGAMVKHIFEVK